MNLIEIKEQFKKEIKNFEEPNPKKEDWRYAKIPKIEFKDFENKFEVFSNLKFKEQENFSNLEYCDKIIAFGLSQLSKNFIKIFESEVSKNFVKLVFKKNSSLSLTFLANESSEIKINLEALSQKSDCFLFIQNYVKKNSFLNLNLIQKLDQESKAFIILRNYLEESSRIKINILNLGSNFSRNVNLNFLNSRNCELEINGISFLNLNQNFDFLIKTFHNSPYTKSSINFKSVLKDESYSVFRGLIKINKGCEKSDAYLSEHSLHLSEGSYSNIIPRLEIEENDVRCTHGSTISNINKEQMFYLESKGLERRFAEKLLIFSFLSSLIKKFELNVEKYIGEKIER